MSNSLDTNLNTNQYFDDFAANSQHHRVLFKPSVPVQARELTQLQTILQSQIEKFGDNIIKNGSIVSGCSFTTSKIEFVKLNDRDSSGDTYVITDFANGYTVHASSNLTFQTTDTKSGFEITNPDLNTLYGRYINSGNSSGVQKDEFSPGDTIIFYPANGQISNTFTIHDGGAAYTYGTVNLGSDYIYSDSSLSSSTTIGSGSGGAITVVISPKEGHGDSAIKELGGHYVMTATTLTQAEGDDISTANDFREVGMVVDPTTYGTSTVASATTVRLTNAVKLSSSSGTFDVDEKISNAVGAIGKVVEWDSTNSIIYYHQERYGDYGTNSTTGAFTTFSGTGTITGATSGATGTPSSSSSETVTLANNNTIAFTSGYANPELQPDSGNIVYTENRKPIQRASDQTEDIKLIIEF